MLRLVSNDCEELLLHSHVGHSKIMTESFAYNEITHVMNCAAEVCLLHAIITGNQIYVRVLSPECRTYNTMTLMNPPKMRRR